MEDKKIAMNDTKIVLDTDSVKLDTYTISEGTIISGMGIFTIIILFAILITLLTLYEK